MANGDTIRMRAVGSQVDAWRNGAHLGTITTSANQTETRVGLVQWIDAFQNGGASRWASITASVI